MAGNIASKTVIGLSVLASALIFQNCSGFSAATSYDVAKANLIQSASIFSAAQIIERDGKCYESTPTGAEMEVPCPTPSPTPVGPTPNPNHEDPHSTPMPNPAPEQPASAPPAQMPVELYCSQDGVGVVGTTLSSASSELIYEFKAADGSNVCQITEPGAKEDVINTSTISIKNLGQKCPNLSSGNYVMTMRSTTGGNSMLMTVAHWNSGDRNWIGKPLHVQVTRSASGQIDLANTDRPPCDGVPTQGWNGFAANNPRGECEGNYGVLAAKVLMNGNPSGGAVAGAGGCTRGTSPLVVQLGEPGPIVLTPPLEGILFDIMGMNASPAYSPKLISWLTPASAPRNYFIVLPNAAGEVRGIDEMFGDNTKGPDGMTSANGYEALAKYDGRNDDGTLSVESWDGFITERDAIFAHLRLWTDLNRDGIAQKHELSTFADHGVVKVDLNFDPNYVETDKYGNQTKMKSVVQTKDGKLHLMYDLWFRTFLR